MKVNLKINDSPVSVEAGATILEAAELLDIRIPTLCHMKMDCLNFEHRSGSCRCACCPGCRSGCGCCRTRGGRSVRQHLQDLQLQVSFIICPKPPSLLVKAVFAFCERRQSIERLAHYPRPYDHGGHVSHPPRDALGG